MSRPAYYNEIDPFAAAWLRALIAKGEIAPGDVDERSIAEVRAADLVGYGQCHFFAGIGVWSHALRRAGWPDDRPVWTGSCPCQPFSSAGKGLGAADERHLWPEFARLIRERRPAVVLGEQVASAAGRAWLDAVHADLEALGYACGAADLCAAGVGAPHIRQRLYWVADADGAGSQGRGLLGAARGGNGAGECAARTSSASRGLADAGRERREGEQVRLRPEAGGRLEAGLPEAAGRGAARGLADAVGLGVRGEGHGAAGAAQGRVQGADGERQRLRSDDRTSGAALADAPLRAGAPHGIGGAADWLLCTDGKWRPVEPGTFPLAHGAPARVGRLRGYGNAIHAEVAATFIGAFLDVEAAR